MAFGHSVLAMSGEESLAQVNREIEHPKLKNLKRAAIVIAIYSLIFTGGATLLASMLIPALPAHAHLPGQPDRRTGHVHGGAAVLRASCFRIFVVLVGFLILSGAINTSIIGSTGVLMRVAEDGVLTDWFRKPHRRFGTSYRIVNLVFILQMVTIIASRGNVIMLGEAYAFGVIWSFTFNSLSMLVLRWKYKGERGWKVPPNIRIGKTEIPARTVFGVHGAADHGAGEPVHQVRGHRQRHRFLRRISSSSSPSPSASTCASTRRRRRQMKDHFQLEHQDTISRESVAIRPGGVIVTMRDLDNPLALKWTLGAHQHGRARCGGDQRAADGRGRPGVSERRAAEFQRARADGLYQGCFGRRELRQEGFAAGGAGRRCICGAGADRQFA